MKLAVILAVLGLLVCVGVLPAAADAMVIDYTGIGSCCLETSFLSSSESLTGVPNTVIGQLAYSDASFSDQPFVTVRISGVVPEPSSVVALLAGGVFILGLTQKRTP